MRQPEHKFAGFPFRVQRAYEEVFTQLKVLGQENNFKDSTVIKELYFKFSSPASWGWSYLDLAYDWGLSHNFEFEMKTGV